VVVLTRGGHQIVGALTPVSASFNRVLDDTSSAQVTVATRGGSDAAACCDLLARVNPWEHELQIRRGGRSAWVGPVKDLTFAPDGTATIDADDLTVWWDHRFIHEEHPREDSRGNIAAEIPGDPDARLNLAMLFLEYHDDALKPDPSPNFSVDLRGTVVPDPGDRSALPESFEYAGDAMRELARTVLDYTAVNRVVTLGSIEVDTPPIATLVDEHWAEPPEIHVAGSEAGNRWVVGGAGGGALGADLFGQAPKPADPNYADDPDAGLASALASPAVARFGLLESSDTESNIEDEESAQRAADRRVALFAEPPTYVSGGKLRPGAPVTQEQLVPGARVRVLLRNGCRKVAPLYRLKSVEFSLDASGETVSVELQPPGAVVAEV
jgi:hypothetical protein